MPSFFFWSAFSPSFPGKFSGSVGIKNPCFFFGGGGGSSCGFLQKKNEGRTGDCREIPQRERDFRSEFAISKFLYSKGAGKSQRSAMGFTVRKGSEKASQKGF